MAALTMKCEFGDYWSPVLSSNLGVRDETEKGERSECHENQRVITLTSTSQDYKVENSSFN